MTKEQAIEWGTKRAVETMQIVAERCGADSLDIVIRTTKPSDLDRAMNADGVPDEHRGAAFEAYMMAARGASARLLGGKG